MLLKIDSPLVSVFCRAVAVAFPLKRLGESPAAEFSRIAPPARVGIHRLPFRGDGVALARGPSWPELKPRVPGQHPLTSARSELHTRHPTRPQWLGLSRLKSMKIRSSNPDRAIAAHLPRYAAAAARIRPPSTLGPTPPAGSPSLLPDLAARAGNGLTDCRETPHGGRRGSAVPVGEAYAANRCTTI